MRILLLTESIPYPADSGGRIKTLNTLRILGRRHDIYCHAFIRSPAQQRHETALRDVASSVSLHYMPRSPIREAMHMASALARAAPYTVERHFDPSVLRRVQQDCDRLQCDVLYCDHLSMMEYGYRVDLPVVLDTHNIEYQILRRYGAGLWPGSPIRALVAREWRSVKAYERRAYSTADLVFAVSDVDAAEIRALSPHAHVCPAGIAIDVDRIQPASRARASKEVLFVGGLHWPPNAEAVTFLLGDVWPSLRQECPDARLTIVGRDHHALSRQWQKSENVVFAGYVDDLEPFYERCAVVVAPVRSGSGLRVKILDAFARAIPVVSTTIGCEGLDVMPGTHLLIGDDAGGFARAVARLLNVSDVAQTIGAAGRRLVEERYSLVAVGAKMHAALDDLASHLTSSPGLPSPDKRSA
jgi:glycosyltransferase involved in cell wall biosynthesis